MSVFFPPHFLLFLPLSGLPQAFGDPAGALIVFRMVIYPILSMSRYSGDINI